MGVVKQILLNFNSFQSPQFFRFNGEPQFTNYLGGIFTILIRAILLALIIYKLLAVFSFSTVYSSTSIQYEIDESKKTYIGPSDTNSPFLLAIEAVIVRSNQNKSELQGNVVAWSFNSSQQYTILEHCTRDHWAAASDSIWNDLITNVNEATTFLFCLPKNFQHQMDVGQ